MSLLFLQFSYFASIVLDSAEGSVINSDNFVDLRGRDLHQPNDLLDGNSGLKRVCCKEFAAVGGRTDYSKRRLSMIGLIGKADLSYNNITFIDDGSFAGWNLLTHLRLDYNGMTNITTDAFKELCLTLLSLKGNKLTFVDFKLLCRQRIIELIDLSNNYLLDIQIQHRALLNRLIYSGNLINTASALRTIVANNLHIEDNKITHFYQYGSLIQPMHWVLREKINIFLDRNLIRRLEGSVAGLNVHILSISHNFIVSLDEEFLLGANSLTIINLSYNRLTEIRDGTFNNLHSLETIDLTGNKLTQINIDAFYRMLGLRKFLITDNPVTQILARFLLHSTELERLELCGAIESPTYFTQFFKLRILKWENADYESLRNISISMLGLDIFHLRSVAILDIVARMNTCNISELSTLALNFVRLDDLPEKMLETSTRLKDLSLAHNLLRSINMEVIPATLEMLNLSRNIIEVTIPSATKMFRSLRILDLQHNQLINIPTFLLHEETQLNFINLKDNRFLDIETLVQLGYLKTDYLCFKNTCANAQAILTNLSDSNSPITNRLGCQCHGSIRNHEGFTTREVFVQQGNFNAFLFKHYVVGCIKQLSIYNGSDLTNLHIIASLASEFSSLHLYNWNLSVISNFRLQCSPQIRRLSIISSGLTYIYQNAFLTMPHLRHLDLSQNAITKFEFGSLQHMPKLLDLNLSHNFLTSLDIPQDIPITEIFQLKNLDLSHNALHEVDFRRLYIFPNLETLKLRSNVIHTVNLDCNKHNRMHICKNFTLEALSLANNRLKELTESVSWTLRNVVLLDLSQNGICQHQLDESAVTCDLNLSSNCITDYKQNGCPNGEFNLDLTRNRIYGLSRISLTSTENILIISSNFIEAIRRDETRDKVTLTELYLAYNSISTLEDGCFSAMTKIKILDLQYNKLRTFDGRNLLSYTIDQHHRRQHFLEKLYLIGNHDLNSISMIVNTTEAFQPKLTIPNLCSIVTQNCRLSGAAIKRYLETQKDKRMDSTRRSLPADIEFYTNHCSEDKTSVLELICVNI